MLRPLDAPRPLLVGLLTVTLLAACGGGADDADDDAAMDTTAADTAGAQTSLYDRLGGEPAIRAVVDDFVARAAADDTLNFTRQGTDRAWDATPENVTLLKERLVQFVGQATGGPQVYEGADMAAAHTGMEITDAEFDRLAGHLVAALQGAEVPQELQDELMAIVGTTRSAIVAPVGDPAG